VVKDFDAARESPPAEKGTNDNDDVSLF
jgi:hypothetical protein